MLKLLIADDEQKVCQLIEYIIDWKEFGIEIIGIANDGQTAFQMISEYKPDIIVTDIRMPMVSGIDLIKKTKELGIDPSFIIISGYSQFEYAQSAIKYGVVNYLLKPIQKKEMIATIEKILNTHKIKSALEKEQNELKKSLAISQNASRDSFIKDFFLNYAAAGLNQNGITSIEDINNRFSCSFREGNFALLIIRPFLETEKNDEKMWDLLISKIKSNADERLGDPVIDKLSLVNEREIIYFLNVPLHSDNQIKKLLQGIIMDNSSLLKIFGKIHTLIGLSNVVEDISAMGDLYFQANCALLNRFSFKEPILRYIPISPENDQKSYLDRKVRGRIISAFESHKQKDIIKEINLSYQFMESEKLKGAEILHCYRELVDCIVFSINTYIPSVSFPDVDELMHKMKEYYSLRDVVYSLQKAVNDSFYTMKESENRPVREAKKYIYENYNSHISLSSISEELGFNPSYFSSLFKKDTGENFIDFVIKVRVDFAKQFLEQTDLDIAEIAEKVGYRDLKYFNKIFKKNVHLTPLEYRRVYG